MHPSKHFIELRKNIAKRLRKYQALVNKANNPFIWPESDYTLSNTVIQSLNLWAVFSRTYFLSCVLSPLRENGTQVTCDPSIRTFSDAINKARRAINWRRSYEPPWEKTQIFMDSCNAIGCSNHQEIQIAFSIQISNNQYDVFEDLQKFRNFYAHRNEDTANKALNIARQHYGIPIIPRNNHPTKMLLQPTLRRPQSCLILDWIDDIINTVDLLCN